MNFRRIIVVILPLGILCDSGLAQDAKPVSLDAVIEAVATNEYKIPLLKNDIDTRGVSFTLDEKNLATVVDAGKRGDRSPAEMSAIILDLLKACSGCRSALWAPLTPPELVNWVRTKGSASGLEELKVRGSESLPISIDYIDELRKAGATPDLIFAVDDRLKIIPADGYKPMRLEKASNFDPQAKSGRLTMRVEIDEEVEFLFRHNALFWKAIRGTAPKDLGSSYTAFGPFSAADPGWSVQQIPNPKAKKPKKAPIVSERKFADSSGRPTLVVSVNDVEPGVHEYELVVSWNR